MYLILDFGNTRIKHFVYREKALVASKVSVFSDLSESLHKTKQEFPKITAILIADVWGKAKTIVSEIFSSQKIIICNLNLNMPFTTRYESPTSFGADRIALLSSICLAYPKQNVLGIDLGTCITFDFIDKNAKHYGGSISPGFEMRYKSVHHFTGQLPELSPKKPNSLIGIDTESGIHSGIYYGILHEIEGQIEFYKARFKNLTVIFVGGDSQRLPMPYKNGIFAPNNFSADGLRHILELNI